MKMSFLRPAAILAALLLCAVFSQAQRKVDSVLYYKKMVIFHQEEINWCQQKSAECDRKMDSIDNVSDTLYSPAWEYYFNEMGFYDRLYNNSIDLRNKYLFYKGKNVLSEYPNYPLSVEERKILKL